MKVPESLHVDFNDVDRLIAKEVSVFETKIITLTSFADKIKK
jgi:hypothetical protein